MPSMIMKHVIDPAKKLMLDIGDISNVELFNNQVLVALYIRPQLTASGIHLTSKTVDEDIYQSKVGLIIKKGPTAFKDTTGTWFSGEKIEEGQWIFSRASDGWTITINKVPCRIYDDVLIRGRIDQPDKVW